MSNKELRTKRWKTGQIRLCETTYSLKWVWRAEKFSFPFHQFMLLQIHFHHSSHLEVAEANVPTVTAAKFTTQS